ncbi:MAG: polysaccharide biosynthesis tyrosine autokinase [Acidobacteria bacterium]|nr:polysaccharide biosynthesis tyrosine autokinase [Acidobacteriota bacterium]
MSTDQVEFDLRQHLRTLYRRRRLAVAAFAIPAVVAFVYAFTATPLYRAQARLLIEPEDPNVVDFQQVITRRNQVSPSLQTTQRDMLQSRSLARATLDELGLWDHPDFGGGLDEGFDPLGAARRALSSLRSAVFPRPAPANRLTDGETLAESRAISMLQNRLRTAGGRNSRVMRLTFTASDGRLAADVVNTLARLHVERDAAFRNTSSREASRWLQQRIADQRHKLEASERALQRYREEHGAVAVEDRQAIVVRELENLHSAVTTATMARVESEARYRDLQGAQGDADSLGRFPEILRNEVIQEQRLNLSNLRRDRARLAEELGPRHPDMISIESSIRDAEQRLQNEVLAVVDSLRIEFQVASSQERQMAAELDRQTEEALVLDRTGIEYGVLLREAESDRSLYEALLQRAAETGVNSELETSNIRVLDSAQTPRRPVSPRRQLALLVGLLGGAFLAVGLVFGIEYLDDTIHNPEEVKAHLDAPYLGMIPAVSWKAAAEGPTGQPGESPERRILLTAEVPADFKESIRSVRTGLIFSSADDGCRMVLTTSTIPGEGKSCISANLAIALAQTGLRTLLIDADLRRPQQHAYFDMDLEPGLSNLLVGAAAEKAAVRETSVPKLSLLSAGKIPPDPTDLLGSKAFRELVESWRGRFDWIVVDSTPVSPVADALVTAQVTVGVLFIVGTGATSWRSAADAIERLRQANGHVLGTVLNKAALDRHPYYYSRYYRTEYARYYSRPQAS